MLVHPERRAWLLGAVLVLLALIAQPAPAATEVADSWVRFEWTPASGPVLGYLVYARFDDKPEALYLATQDTFTRVFGSPGTTVSVRVVAFDAATRQGPSSPESDPVLFVDSTAPPAGDGDPQPTDPPPDGDPPPDPGDAPAPPPELPATALDFDGNGTSDLPIRSRDEATFRVLGRDGASSIGPVLSAAIPGQLELVGMADQDGDGLADTLWRDGDAGLLLLRSAGPGVLEPIEFPPGARVEGSGDFDGDGRGDLVVNDLDAQTLSLWLMDGTQRLGTLPLFRWRGPAELVASADVDGDDLAELVIRDPTTQRMSVWSVDGGQLSGWVALDSSALGADWVVIGAGDLDGDGRQELLWLDPASGQLYAWWFLPGGQTDVRSLTLPDWDAPTPVAVGDFTGDGRTGLLTQDATGVVTLWLLDGVEAYGRQNLVRLVPGWDVEAVGAENPELK